MAYPFKTLLSPSMNFKRGTTIRKISRDLKAINPIKVLKHIQCSSGMQKLITNSSTIENQLTKTRN